MKTKSFRIISILVVFALLFQGGSAVFSASKDMQLEYNLLTVKQLDENDEENEIEPQALHIPIFFAGIVVGWVADGVIQYATGYNASFWVAQGFSNMDSKIRSFARQPMVINIYVSDTGSLSTYCTSFPCPMFTPIENPEEE